MTGVVAHASSASYEVPGMTQFMRLSLPLEWNIIRVAVPRTQQKNACLM